MESNKKLEITFLAQLLAMPDASRWQRACASVLVDDDFTGEDNATVWRTCCRLADNGHEVNYVNAYTELTKAGAAVDLSRYLSKTWTGELLLMADTLHEIGVKRRLHDDLVGVVLTLNDDATTSAEALQQLTATLNDAQKATARTLTAWPELCTRVIKQIQDKANGLTSKGVPSGFELIDNEGGLERGALIIIAGRTSNGKTALALNIALNVAKAGEAVAVYSLEMTNEQVGGRMLATLSGVPLTAIKSAKLTDEQWGALTASAPSMPLYFDDSRATGKDAIFRAIKYAVDTRGARVVFVDYLQLVKGQGRDRRQDVGDIANELKVLAVQLNITVILLSQLAREQKGAQPVPKLSELKESGEIENAADAVYLIYRPEQHGPDYPFPDLSERWSRYSTEGNALLICAKNRNGRTGEQLLGWDGDTSRFFVRRAYEPADGNGSQFDPIW